MLPCKEKPVNTGLYFFAKSAKKQGLIAGPCIYPTIHYALIMHTQRIVATSYRDNRGLSYFIGNYFRNVIILVCYK